MTIRLPLAGAALIFAALLSAQDAPQGEPEVLTRGPIHEAYAATVTQSPTPGPLVTKAPPQPIEELPPDQKPDGDNIQWIPGYFAWDEDRNDYIWISGFWRQPPPNRQWMPGAWRQEGASYQWTSGFWADANVTQVEYVPPPPETIDNGPTTPAQGENYTWVAGNWVYRDTRFLWQPGFWCPYRPDWVYVPAHYVWSPCGYVFVHGYYDYPLRRRGVIFAPVYFGVRYRPNYVYRPSYVVYDDALYGALFVRPGRSSYYFGDYFEARYRTAGYRSWIDVRIGVGAYDPLYGYYRHHHAHTPGWSVTLSNTYAGRYRGDIPRPPRTLVQQNTIINNTTVNNVNVKNVTMVAPINKVDRSVVNFRPVTKTEQVAAVQAAKSVNTASVQRVKMEQQAVANRGTPRGGQTQHPIKLDLPKSAVVNATPAVQPPQSPKADPPKDRPKTSTPAPKEQPKEQPKSKTPAPKETPKSPPPAPPKETPKTPPPKETPKSPPPVPPKETPKTPPPKETPKSPPPAPPKETPKTPPPRETPKTPPPAPPKETPKTPPPAPPKKAPPPPPKEKPKTPPPAPSKETRKSPTPAPPMPTPKPSPPAPPPPKRTPPSPPRTPPPPPREKPKSPPPAEKKGDKKGGELASQMEWPQS